MKKLSSIILSGLFLFNSYAKAEESATTPVKSETSLISQEKPAEIVNEVIVEGDITRKDVLNFLSRLDEEKIDDRSRYAKGNILENFMIALNEEIDKDLLFYAGEDYDADDFIIKNQVLSASWENLVGRYPKIFGRLEKAAIMAKRLTTLETPKVCDYSLKFNPELDSDNYPRAKLRLKSEKNSYLDRTYLRIGRDEIQIGKTFDLSSWGKKASIDFDLESDYKNGYCFEITIKFPWWFWGEEEYLNRKDLVNNEHGAAKSKD